MIRLSVVSLCVCLAVSLSARVIEKSHLTPKEVTLKKPDPRFKPFSDDFTQIKPPEPKPGCDFCLEENHCKQWDEACAIAHPECSDKCGRLVVVPGPACLTCLEDNNCKEWDENCNNKAPQCKLFCQCGEYQTCGECAKTRMCSWCAFSADSKNDDMGACRYATNPDMAKCPPPAFFARYPNQCKLAARVEQGADLTNLVTPKASKPNFDIPDNIPPASPRKYLEVTGVNYAPPPIHPNVLNNPHNPQYQHQIKAAAIAALHLHSGEQATMTISEGTDDVVVEKKPPLHIPQAYVH